ncbi:hypothetical protein OU798_06275 [Prolixibacteraceae bacterium Z1-6]|uniref:Receptor L-domain domain-containing protein n=1 Tax=Draconibacterium aestuarii TaxID=2998507 RepID=A0A9X3J5Y0_9BACT|nr:hypothetical protein [Prolixibacteraceae bacterium Z1-6]
MKKKLLSIAFVAALAILGGCVGDDIDDLQNQIDDLNSKVDDLEQTQLENLLNQIAALQASITNLQNKDTELSDQLDEQYNSLLNNLSLLEEEVNNNASAVYYGNLLTDADFAAVLEQGATIVTGKAQPVTSAHISAMANIKLIGGDLLVTGTETIALDMLQSVGGSLTVTGISTADVSVSLPALASVGQDVKVVGNSGLSAFSADALILINNDLNITANELLNSVSLSMLDQVANVNINGYVESSYGAGPLASIDLSYTDVLGDVAVQYLSGGQLTVGNVGGSFACENTSLASIDVASAVIGGDFVVSYNNALETLDVTDITTIEGNLTIQSNGPSSTGGWSSEKSASSAATFDVFPAFDALETIGGDVVIESNTSTSIEAFNNVTTFTGSSISFGSNGNFQLTVLNVFNKLETAGASSWNHVNISIFQNLEWFDAFKMLTKAGDISLNLSRTQDPNTWEQGTTLRVDGFDAMTEAKSLSLYSPAVTQFNAFGALNHISGYATDLKVEMFADTSVGMCSMEPFFTIIKDNPTKYNVIFNAGWNNPIDTNTAIDQLLAPCSN